MKIAMLLIAVCSIVANVTSEGVQFENALWRQKVVLFQSTRADVEKLFGKPIGENGSPYRLEDGTLYLEYYDYDHCKPWHGRAADWNIPEWTVTEITFSPSQPLQFKAFKLDLKGFRTAHLSPEVPDLLSYISDQQGVEYTLEPDGTLNEVRYCPGTSYDRFRCPKKR